MSLSAQVREAFQLGGSVPQPLEGGDETSLLVGDVVVKKVLDPDVGRWLQGLSDRTQSEGDLGFRLPRPVPTTDGGWIHDGWIASEFIPGLRSLAHDPAEVIRVGRLFADAAVIHKPADLSPVLNRTDRWARGFRAAMGTEEIGLDPPAASVAGRLRARVERRRDDPASRVELIHCDLTGNVFQDGQGIPVVLDISPGLAEVEMGSAIVVADHLLWRDGSPSLAALLTGREDLLAKGLLFRLYSEQLALLDGQKPRHEGRPDDYRRVLSLLGW